MRQGPLESLNKTNIILKGYLTGLGYHVLSKTRRPELRDRIITHMELKNLWNLGEDKAKFLSKRGCRKRKKLQVKKKVSRKRRKLSDEKKSQSLEKSASQKPKRKLSNKKLSAKKKKSKKEKEGEKKSNKKVEEEKLLERYLMPDELLFEKFLLQRKGYRIEPIKRDGNCLFRAVADQVLGDRSKHAALRNMCANHIEENKDYFVHFINVNNIDFNQYIKFTH